MADKLTLDMLSKLIAHRNIAPADATETDEEVDDTAPDSIDTPKQQSWEQGEESFSTSGDEQSRNLRINDIAGELAYRGVSPLSVMADYADLPKDSKVRFALELLGPGAMAKGAVAGAIKGTAENKAFLKMLEDALSKVKVTEDVVPIKQYMKKMPEAAQQKLKNKVGLKGAFNRMSGDISTERAKLDDIRDKMAVAVEQKIPLNPRIGPPDPRQEKLVNLWRDFMRSTPPD